MFGADGQADGVWPDALVQQFFRRVLRMRGGCRMDNQRFDIGHIGQQREKFQMINPIPGVTLVSLQIESEDRSAVVRIILLIQLLLFRIPGNGRMTDILNFRAALEILQNFLCIFYLSLHAKTQCFKPLQENPCVNRGQGSAFIAKNDGTKISGNNCRRCISGKNKSVIRFIRSGKPRPFI